jgi:hypothetical protein
VLATLVVTAALALGCDSGNHSKDASPTSSQQLAQVSVRLDLPTGGAPFLSMLAFRAEVTDVATPDVLGAVDPLVAPAPESACELRDVAGVARTVRAQGGVVNLQELSGVSLFVGEEQPPVHPAPKVYPPLADVVGGVIAEFGPLDLPQVPQSIGLVVPGQSSDAPITWAPPAALAVADSGDVPLGAETQLTMKGDLVLRVLGPLRTFLEVRPFGAPSAITCAVTSGGWVVVPHDLLVKLEASAGRAPISFEAVWRENRLVLAGSEVMRVSFEARSSAVLELRP